MCLAAFVGWYYDIGPENVSRTSSRARVVVLIPDEIAAEEFLAGE